MGELTPVPLKPDNLSELSLSNGQKLDGSDNGAIVVVVPSRYKRFFSKNIYKN